MKGMKDIKYSVNCWVFQVLLAGIEVHVEKKNKNPVEMMNPCLAEGINRFIFRLYSFWNDTENPTQQRTNMETLKLLQNIYENRVLYCCTNSEEKCVNNI